MSPESGASLDERQLRTYSGSPHVGRMREVHVVEQEKDGVQSVVLLRLTFFPCPVIEKNIKLRGFHQNIET